jgi:CBS domain-containing protein
MREAQVERPDETQRDGQGPATGPGPEVLTVYSPLSALVRRDPATIPLDATVRQALEGMQARRVRAVVVTDPGGRVPVGTFTLEDLVRRVVLPGGDLSQPVAAAMTGAPVALSPQATAHQAALTMARGGVGQVVVVDSAGLLIGVVTQDDLFGLRRGGVEALGAQIQACQDLAGLQRAAARSRGLADGLLARGLGAETVTEVISTLNDLLTIRLIELTSDRFELPPVPFCWLALGSEGRLEQTFATDQDNGLIFEADPREVEEVRSAFLPFAGAVNDGLDALGFPLCRGKVMASNPQWCLSLDEWKWAFAAWIQEPAPEALLNATIFFDFRPIYGAESLAARLREWLHGAAAERPVFLRFMAQNALGARPPLGTFRRFAVERTGPHRHTLDLKQAGSRLFVDAARVLALAHGVPHTNTGARLRAVAAAGRLGEEGVAAMLDAFFFIHRLRLRQQRRAGVASPAANRVDPRDLNQLERQVLAEAFRQAKRLQLALAQGYQL